MPLEQVQRILTRIPALVPCNPERKHCSAHSLAGRPDGSRQRAGQQWSQCQRTVSGGRATHTHSLGGRSTAE